MAISDKVVNTLLNEGIFKEFRSEDEARRWVLGQGYALVFRGGGGEIYEKDVHRLYFTHPGIYQEPIWRVFE